MASCQNTRCKNEGSSELCLIGVEDGSFKAFSRELSHAILCCVKMKDDLITLVKTSTIQVDGLDATEKLLTLLKSVTAEAIILGGITFAGFNVIDPHLVFRETGIPVIIYSGKKPDNKAMLLALRKHFDDWLERWKIVESLGEVHETITKINEPPVYFEVVGGYKSWAKEVLRHSALVCRIPEPVRVAKLIARGLSLM